MERETASNHQARWPVAGDIPPATRAIEFLQAGGDLIISKYVQPAGHMADAVLARIGSDPAFRSRVDDATMRVLSAKEASGLLPC